MAMPEPTFAEKMKPASAMEMRIIPRHSSKRFLGRP
jgi:hypothetical protein